MRKNYYYTFGSTATDLQIIVDLLQDKLDLLFEPHESSYFGNYYKYSGLYADSIIIKSNFNTAENDWTDEGLKEYTTLIDVSNIHGRNADKLSKSTYLIRAFRNMSDITLLKEKIIEEV
ncbi:hypothetical protein [Chitinophaga nivalis]|uniref:Uncharacterized protein n=1 Tax=Chitinophaga nivalis TaxID=2991709 RepID=A0ABT3IPP1_9BACT|nr:hypothetical protein [Chitinophaga nivalis]MCW3464379.1 hypothetical protein [Chitinophaga nivalis]MCW3485930.1 hypothetical protein [Chitinophaga nivalis]